MDKPNDLTVDDLELRALTLISHERVGAAQEPNSDPVVIEFFNVLNYTFGAGVARVFSSLQKPRAVMMLNDLGYPTPGSSQIGGYPFLTAEESDDFVWPRNSDGAPLTFLMQVNLAEVPMAAGMPATGLIQWWVDGSDDLYGMDMYTMKPNPERFMVRHYTQEELYSVGSLPGYTIPNDVDSDELRPLSSSQPVRVNFRESVSFPSAEDHDVDRDVLDLMIDVQDELLRVYGQTDPYWKDLFERRSQVGGWINPIHSDPRYNLDENEFPHKLAIQLNSESGFSGDIVSWGEEGVAHLFADFDDNGAPKKAWWSWDSN